jgi:phosphatidylserine/phosphatidylglycerophosphate/cardiolipin synthase-like enzyme
MEWLMFLLFQSTGTIDLAFCPQTNCEEFFLNHLKQQKEPVCAFYQVTKQEFFDHAKIYVYDENYQKKGTPLKSKGLMHHKFCVLNKTHSIISSANPTANLHHHNNVLLIESKIVVWNLKQELRRLKGKQPIFIKSFKFNGHKTNQLFCQKHNCKQKIHESVKEANKIRFLFFTFTDKELANLLYAKHNQTNDVFGVIEGWQNTNVWAVPNLKTTPHTINTGVIQHSKTIMTDKVLITGSLNPTNNGYKNNDEQILVFTDPRILNAYFKYYEDNW